VTQRQSYLTALLVTILALVYALWNVDLHELGRLLRGGDYRTFWAFLACLVAIYWLKAIRWTLILRPLGDYTYRQVLPALMIGFAANNLLPARLGEILRTLVFAGQYRRSRTGVFVSLVLERVFDTCSILLLFVVAATMLDETITGLRITAWLTTALLVAVCTFLYFAVTRLDKLIALWDSVSARLSDNIRDRGRRALRSAVSVVASIDSYRTAIVMLWYSLLQWALMAANAWLALRTFDIVVDAPVAVVVITVVALAAAVPNAPGYIGAIQAAFVFALSPFGVAQEVALASSAFFLIANWLPVTAVGALYFIGSGIHLSDARRGIEDIRHEQR
jgi:uncharacterized protein (TIRG00374 family)